MATKTVNDRESDEDLERFCDNETAMQHACWEIDALLHMLRRESQRDVDGDFGLVLRGTLPRIIALNELVMSVAGGDDIQEEGMTLVFGPHEEAHHG